MTPAPPKSGWKLTGQVDAFSLFTKVVLSDRNFDGVFERLSMKAPANKSVTVSSAVAPDLCTLLERAVAEGPCFRFSEEKSGSRVLSNGPKNICERMDVAVYEYIDEAEAHTQR